MDHANQRRDSIGESELSQNVIENATRQGGFEEGDVIINIRHYNSLRDRANGLNSNTNQNSQIITVKDVNGRYWDIHSHQQGAFISRVE
ncbi:hypothetical protein NDM58_004524 [Vibrio parahaemolyticus]|nr:hypothetical protein [Vibrio parahaemolyticus]